MNCDHPIGPGISFNDINERYRLVSPVVFRAAFVTCGVRKRYLELGWDSTVKSSGLTTAERVIEVVLCVICVVVAIALAAWQRSVILMIFAAVVTVFIPLSLVRSRKLGEEEMMRRQDKAIGKPTDDPREMARWVP